MDVNTLASKRSELLGNAEILRMRRVIHNNSTCVCLRIPVAAITQKRKNASVDLWPALGVPFMATIVDLLLVSGSYRVDDVTRNTSRARGLIAVRGVK